MPGVRLDGQPAHEARGVRVTGGMKRIPGGVGKMRDDIGMRRFLQHHDLRIDGANHLGKLVLLADATVADVVAHYSRHFPMSSTHGWSIVTSRMNCTIDVVA